MSAERRLSLALTLALILVLLSIATLTVVRIVHEVKPTPSQYRVYYCDSEKRCTDEGVRTS